MVIKMAVILIWKIYNKFNDIFIIHLRTKITTQITLDTRNIRDFSFKHLLLVRA